jgi:hypothetical protein
VYKILYLPLAVFVTDGKSRPDRLVELTFPNWDSAEDCIVFDLFFFWNEDMTVIYNTHKQNLTANQKAERKAVPKHLLEAVEVPTCLK